MIRFVQFIWGVANFFLRGYVFMMVWNWFPHTILNAPALTMTTSFGFLMVILFFKRFDIQTKKDRDRRKAEMEQYEVLENCLSMSLINGTILLIAWIITLFM